MALLRAQNTLTAKTARHVRASLRAVADPARAAIMQRFFKTGRGEYAAGDRFIGVDVPTQRRIAREFAALPLTESGQLLQSRVHEERLTALLILVRQFERGNEAQRRAIHTLYRRRLDCINNWDLVDSSAPYILGGWLEKRSRASLRRLAASPNLWHRRIALLATLHFIRRGEAHDTLELAARLRNDPHDLIHKAAGWMLREVGQRIGPTPLRAFLKQQAAHMPRTMLRYAIERLPARERSRWLAIRVAEPPRTTRS